MTILVTGATGTIGSEILTLLATERKAPVRALVHTAAKMADVAARGAEPHLGVFEDPASLRAAMRGADTLILITSANPHAAEQASNAVDAAVEAGMRRIVRISAIKANPNGPTDNTRQHGMTEAKIASSGLAYVILRPSFFMQNLFLAAQNIAEEGQFHFGMGDGRIGMIDTRDIAGCAARCVLSDAAHRYIPSTVDMDWGDKPCRKAGSVRLRDICKDDKTVLTYVYDFGDDWRMNVSVTDIRQGDPDTGYPRYLGGERAAPPEDCGGVPGFYELLDAYDDPEHPDHEEVREWLDERDPHFFDELPIKYALLRIANRRNAARKRLRPKAT